jgi:outer membrane receptor protein involved in Fe transport
MDSLLANEQNHISEVVVTAQRRPQPKRFYAGNIKRIDVKTLERVQHQHLNELMTRVPGAWVVRGSGQEHQTAIRSPVLGGGGSCGGFLVLEDGIPIRPAGFCNINQFTEAMTEQAHSVEVIRGPGNALYGSNALHGIVNVLMPSPGDAPESHIALEAGANDFFRVRFTLPVNPDSSWLGSAVYADDGGFRDDSGYRQGKVHLKGGGSLLGGNLLVGFSATNLSQDTAGLIVGEDAYKDPAVNRSNPTPEAFRDVSSQRLYGIWTRSLPRFDLDVRPYARQSDMQFMHFAIPGQPIEDNGHHSFGVLSSATFTGTHHQIATGVDAEWSDIFLEQTQFGPAQGTPPVRETRPEGKHYDYGVNSISLAAFVQTGYQLNERISLGGGLRLEFMHYDYDNHMLSGNTRDDGTTCGFGGCLYSRPADRTDSFTNLAPKLSAIFKLSGESQLFANLARGFRVPQALELYRLQNGQQIADLESETIDSFEAGLRTSRQTWSADVVVYLMRKHDSVFRDSDGFNVSGGRSRHIGIETAIDWQLHPAWRFSLDASYASHTYDFDFSGRGESFVSGNDIDTAPHWLGSTELFYQPTNKLWLSLQWTILGEYYLDAANRFSYPGHSLAHLRASLQLSPKFNLLLRLNNITDEVIADRADYAARNYRYLPGRGREMFIEIRYLPSRT